MQTKKNSMPEKTLKTAVNLAFLRVYLGGGAGRLSMEEMACALGANGQGTYKGWEKNIKTPPPIRETLHEAGVNLNWFDTGIGEMLRPGVVRIRVVRDDLTGKPKGLEPVLEAPQAFGAASTPPRDQLRNEAQLLVDEVVGDLRTPQQRGHYLELVEEVASLLEILHSQGRAHEIRLRLETALPAAKEPGRTDA